MLRLDREARGAVDSSARFILYNHANGLQKFHLDKSTVSSPGSFQLASFMTHFEPHKADLTVVQNLFCKTGEHLHGNASSALSCTQRGAIIDVGGSSEMVVGGPTIDQVIANELGQQTRLRSLVLGHPFPVSDGNCAQGTIAGRAKNEPVYPTLDPVKAHELVFGMGGKQDEVLIARQKSYIDFIKDDVATFQGELPAAERQKLEQYLESIREIERALASGSVGGCQDPGSQSFNLEGPMGGDGANNPKFWQYMCDLAVAAVQCGATQQVSLLHTYGCVHMTYEFDGVTRIHHQDVAHGDEEGEFMAKILGFHAQQVAYVYQKLKDAKTAAGSLADSTLMAWMSDGGGQHHGGVDSHPMIYLGRANGRLKGGQWLRLQQGQTALACAHLTTARAIGLELQTFGDGTDPCSGPIPGVLS